MDGKRTRIPTDLLVLLVLIRMISCLFGFGVIWKCLADESSSEYFRAFRSSTVSDVFVPPVRLCEIRLHLNLRTHFLDF